MCKFLSFAVHPLFFFCRCPHYFPLCFVRDVPSVTDIVSTFRVYCFLPVCVMSRFLFMLPFCSCSQYRYLLQVLRMSCIPGRLRFFKSESTFAVRRSVRESKKKAALFARATITVPIFMASYLTPSVGRWTLMSEIFSVRGRRPSNHEFMS